MVAFADRYGPWALVAGAAEGIGAAWAEALARRGLALVLVDRQAEKLTAAAGGLARAHAIDVHPIVLDLGDPGAVERLIVDAGDREVGLLVWNAAHSPLGGYLDLPSDAHERSVRVNCLGPALAVHHFARGMRARRRGGVILMSSLSGLQGAPLIAQYGATKAYNLVLAEGLWDEWRDEGVDVLAVCPGATLTPSYLAVRPTGAGWRAPPEMLAEAVVAEALAALGRRPFVIPGRTNRLGAFFLGRVLSRMRAIRIMGRVARRLRAARPPVG
jgi:uncharacterized protein